MSTTRVLPRLGVTVGALLVALLVGSPAFAADTVSVDISGFSASLSAGARQPESFSATIKNESNSEIQPIRRIIVVKLAGLDAKHVRISRGIPLPATGTDEVRATDALNASLRPKNSRTGSSVKQDYTIQILAGAPNGKGSLVVEVYHNNDLIGSSTKSFTVKGGVVTPSAPPSATPEPTTETQAAPATNPADNAPPIVSLDSDKPQSAANTSGGGVPTALYVMGAILVAMGGVILWVLFRPRPQLAEVAGPGQGHPTDPYPPAPAGTAYRTDSDRAPTLGYPRENRSSGRHTANSQPTTVMPVVRDSSPTPPPVDPWASQAGGFTDHIPPTR